MSIGGDRQAIADALSEVSGVIGSKYRPIVLTPGSAWPLVEGIDRDRDYQVTWRAVVVLPTDERKASEWFDTYYEDVAGALESFGYVERIEPGVVATEAGDLEAMFITVRKEA